MGINETDHRFIGLQLDEVSLVDTPANEEVWLTIKRLEADEMTTEKTKPTEEIKPETETEAVEKSAEETTETAVVEKADEASPDTTTEITEEDAEKALNPMQALALLKKIEALLKGAASGDGGGKAPPFGKKTKKSLMGLTDDGELVINAELLKDVQKARSFTGKRIGAITDAAKAMITLLNEVAPDQVKKLIEFAPKPDVVPAKKSVFSPDATTEPVSEPESASEPEKVDIGATIVEAVTKAVSPLDERLKAIEGARGEPKSNDGDQTADITKRNESDDVFSGLL
jgi:hypothetical protein